MDKKILTTTEIKKLATVPGTNFISASKVIKLEQQNARLKKIEEKKKGVKNA